MVANAHPLVLFVEDNPDDQELARLVLAKREDRCEHLFVDDGQEAIEYLEASSAGEVRRPEVVLIDIAMPRMDGLTLLQRIRGDARWRRIPVVMFTTSTAQSDIEQAYEFGCNAYVVKPYTVKELASVIDHLLEHWLERVRLPLH